MSKVEFYQDKQGDWRWKCVARNGRIVADCAEGYKTKRAAEHGAHVALCALCDWCESEE